MLDAWQRGRTRFRRKDNFTKFFLITTLLCGLSLLPSGGQTFVGTAGGGLTQFGVRVEVAGTARIVGDVFDTHGRVDLASTLNAGVISFNYLNYTSGNGVSLSTSIQRTDPVTFQTATYLFTTTLDPYEFYSSALGGVPLIAENDGSLRFDASSTFTRQPIAITGTYAVDGPNQDVSGTFGRTVQPLTSSPDLRGFLYVPNYPAYIGLQLSTGSSLDFFHVGELWPLASGTIDGFPFRVDLFSLNGRFIGNNNINVELTPVPEPRLAAVVAGLSILAFGIVRRVRR